MLVDPVHKVADLHKGKEFMQRRKHHLCVDPGVEEPAAPDAPADDAAQVAAPVTVVTHKRAAGVALIQ